MSTRVLPPPPPFLRHRSSASPVFVRCTGTAAVSSLRYRCYSKTKAACQNLQQPPVRSSRAYPFFILASCQHLSSPGVRQSASASHLQTPICLDSGRHLLISALRRRKTPQQTALPCFCVCLCFPGRVNISL